MLEFTLDGTEEKSARKLETLKQFDIDAHIRYDRRSVPCESRRVLVVNPKDWREHYIAQGVYHSA